MSGTRYAVRYVDTDGASPPPTLPHGVRQWQYEQLILECAVLEAVRDTMRERFAATKEEACAAIDATAPFVEQIRREVFKVLRKRRRNARTAAEEPS